MAILIRVSAILLYCDSAHCLLLAVEYLGDSRPRDSGNRVFAIRDSVPLSRYCRYRFASLSSIFHICRRGQQDRVSR